VLLYDLSKFTNSKFLSGVPLHTGMGRRVSGCAAEVLRKVKGKEEKKCGI
jgi:hypothetical protein